MDFSTIFQNIQKSVVEVLALHSQDYIVPMGSGTVIGSGNLVLTCAHCINPNTTPAARFSGQSGCKIGDVIFKDQQVDVALIKFQDTLGPPIPIRTSSSLLVGHEVFVVGFPNEISRITALSGNVAGFEPTYHHNFSYIRIDASINHGNSGGPLFNSSGELVGVVNAKHGSLSTFLEQVQNAQPGASMSIGGIDPVQVIQQLIGEMKKNLNLGIGYAIPTDHIGSLNMLVKKEIQNY